MLSTNIIKNMFSHNHKNGTIVDYDDITYVGEQKEKYKLYAVIIHKLVYHCVWHYICYCKDLESMKWKLLNDNKINDFDNVKNIVDKDACLLFNRKS